MPPDEEENTNNDRSTSREGSSNGHGNGNDYDEEEDHNTARSKKVARLEARLAELEEENTLYRCILETQEGLVVGTHYFFLLFFIFLEMLSVIIYLFIFWKMFTCCAHVLL